MAGQQGGGKKKRTHKVSEGLRKHRKVPLTALQLALLGKGLVASFVPVEAKTAWRGVGNATTPFDRQQAALNKILYPHLYDQRDSSTRRAGELSGLPTSAPEVGIPTRGTR